MISYFSDNYSKIYIGLLGQLKDAAIIQESVKVKIFKVIYNIRFV